MKKTMSRQQLSAYSFIKLQLGQDSQLDWLLEQMFENWYDNAIDNIMSKKFVDFHKNDIDAACEHAYEVLNSSI